MTLRECYNSSDTKLNMASEYGFPSLDATKRATAEFQKAVAKEKAPWLPQISPFTVFFKTQLVSAIIRQYQIIWGDKATFVIKNATILVLALVTGSLFYKVPDNTAGLFTKGGSLFISLLGFGLTAMSEVTDSFSGRTVLAKHKDFAFYHHAAFCSSQITSDIPVILCQVTVWSLIVYFMTGLTTTADAFFTFWLVLFSVSICMTALLRLIGAAFGNFDDASKVSESVVSAAIIYSGYMIPKTRMHSWFVWLYRINPLAYGFQALMAN